MEIHFVRHGQSMGNLTGDYSTNDHDRLSPLGQEQARALAARLAGKEYAAIYTSSLSRAMETVLPYLRSRNLVAEVWTDLAEACWQDDPDAPVPPGSRVGEPLLLPPDWSPWFAVPDHARFQAPGDEVFCEGLARIQRACQRIRERHGHGHERILLVGHGFSGSRLLETFLELPPRPWNRFDHDNTALSELHCPPRGPVRLRRLNHI